MHYAERVVDGKVSALSTRVIREWAKRNHFSVGERGRVSRSLKLAFHDAVHHVDLFGSEPVELEIRLPGSALLDDRLSDVLADHLAGAQASMRLRLKGAR